jgi:glycosyltransferase involved in cell wall biosynthesis
VRESGSRHIMAGACRQRVAAADFSHATNGLVAACEAVAQPARRPRVVLCGSGMVIAGGLERMTFEVLRVVRDRGGAVHCIVNNWENHRIVALAETIGASWSTAFHYYTLRRRAEHVGEVLQMAWDIARTSAGLLGDALTFDATHVLVPEYGAVLRNAPALALLRLAGVEIVFRMGNAPERGRFYDVLWRHAVSPFVTRFVPNSQFGQDRLQQTGIDGRKITLIRNAPSRRALTRATDEDIVALARSRRTVLTVGQIAPFKGTHIAIEAVLRLLAEGRDMQAIIVGAMPSWPDDLVTYASDLQDRVRRAGAVDRVHFVGARENVPAIMNASYVLAAPILQEETFGNVVLEARNAGLPVVTFDRGGLVELVADRETGFVCRSADVEGLVEGLEYFLSQPAERARASTNSLAASERPGEDRTTAEFERRWWALFAQAS